MTTADLMKKVLYALLPGALMMGYFFGAGIILNVLGGMLTSIALELLVFRIRNIPARTVYDGSALVTGALLGLALPPYLPFSILFIGCLFAMIFAKHMYGGTGQNLFNPAMVGFAVMIVSFPLAMSSWPQSDVVSYSLIDVALIKSGYTVVDGYTGATPLDQFKFRGALTTDEFRDRVGDDGWQQWLVINMAFLLGGFYMVREKICTWRAPLTMLLTLLVLSGIFYDGGSSDSLGSPLFHLFSGATMLGAFFIATDPVTSPDTNQGQIGFGVGVGLLTFIIRSVGAYPEGIAFAILLMNAASPLLDHIVFRFTRYSTRAEQP